MIKPPYYFHSIITCTPMCNFGKRLLLVLPFLFISNFSIEAFANDHNKYSKTQTVSINKSSKAQNNSISKMQFRSGTREAYYTNEFYFGGALNVTKNSYSANSITANQKMQYIGNLLTLNRTQIDSLNYRQNTQIPALVTDNNNSILIKGDAITTAEKALISMQDANNLDLQPAIQGLKNEIMNLQNILSGLQSQNTLLTIEKDSINNKITALNAQVAELDKTKKSFADVQNSSSSNSIGGSLMVGFQGHRENFFLGAELGVNIGNVNIGRNSDNEIAFKNTFGFFAMIRPGYEIDRNLFGYLNFGLKMQKYNMRYGVGNFNFSESANIKYVVLGLGIEKRISKKIGLFGELNYATGINSATFTSTGQEFKMHTTQLNTGLKYYFEL